MKIRIASMAIAAALCSALQSKAVTLPDSAKPAAGQQHIYRCILAPEPRLCESEYTKALRDSSPEAASLRDAYERYARYLTGTTALTAADRQYLKTNQIDLPNDLSPLQTSGLHNVINELQKNAADRKDNVTNYLSRAEEANIYCGLDGCANPNTGSS